MAYIDDINVGTPANTDPVSDGAVEIRDFKVDVTGSFPSLGQAAVTKTAAEINAAITPDSTDTLTNKTIDNGAYTGTQTGFVGDVDGDITGNAATATLAANVTTNANLTGPVTSVGNATTITADSVNFATQINNTVVDSQLTSVPTSGTVLTAPGVYNLGEVTSGNSYVVQIHDGINWRTISDPIITGGYQVISDGLSVRVASTTGTSNVRYRMIFV